MQAHADLFGLGGNDLLASTGVAPIGKNWHVARFAQTHDQVPVRGASVKVVLDDKNRVVAVGNSTIPGIGKSSTPTIDTVGAAAVLKAKYSSLANQTSNLLYVPTNDVCNPAALAHEVRFSAGDGQRVADVDAHSGVVLSDSLQIEHALTGLWKCNSASCDEFYEVVSSCSVLPCSQRSLTNTAPYYWMSVCTWMEDLWNWWADVGLHGTYARQGFNGSCLETRVGTLVDTHAVVDHGYVQLATDYTHSKDVLAHEFGHLLVIEERAGHIALDPVAYSREKVVEEHLADMHAMSVDSDDWAIPDAPCDTASGSYIRDWAHPWASTVYCSTGLNVAFPAHFDEYNSHSIGEGPSTYSGTRPGWMVRYHIGSTLWSHMLYRLAQRTEISPDPATRRLLAVEQSYRALVDNIDGANDLTMLKYAFWLRVQGDAWGAPFSYLMREVQDQVGLWRLSELVLTDAYSRPGIVAAGRWDIGFNIVVYYRWRIPGQVDQFRQAVRDSSGQWTKSDTGLPPQLVASSITAAYDQNTLTHFVAWRASDGSLLYAKRCHTCSWGTVEAVAGAAATDDPALAAGDGHVILFYRDAGSGRLRYLKWTGSGWGVVQQMPGSSEYDRGPSATYDWERNKFVVAVQEEGVAYLFELTYGRQDLWTQAGAFDSCVYNVGSHAFSGPVSIEPVGDRLYMLGIHPPSPAQDELEQAVAVREGGVWSFKHHGYLERFGTAVDMAQLGGLYAVVWGGDAASNWASVYFKATP